MERDVDDFEQIDTTEDGIEVLQNVVKTPLPESDGSGYRSEKSLQSGYLVDGVLITISRISSFGWSVWQYEQEDGSWEIGERLCSGEDAQTAQRIGRQRAIEVAQ